MARLLALDVGSKRIGIAVSDELGILATPHGTIERRSLRHDLAAILELVRDFAIKRIVVGLPVGLEDQETQQTRRTRAFAARLAGQAAVPVDLWDERHTSWAARQIVGGSAAVRRSGRVDAVAAALILQSYLDNHATAEERPSWSGAAGDPPR
jgi:putative Holliday junction resolvase